MSTVFAGDRKRSVSGDLRHVSIVVRHKTSELWHWKEQYKTNTPVPGLQTKVGTNQSTKLAATFHAE